MDFHNLNIARISEKVSDIKQSMLVLQNYAEQGDEEFLGNPEAIRSARYAFIVLIEASINIANHICARILHKAPASYADSFLLLGDKKIIEIELSKRLSKMAGFRNLLVHGYGEVDDQRMLSIMREDLQDMTRYLGEIGRLLNNQGGGSS